MISAKMANSVLLKITVFWIKGYDVIIHVDDVISKILSRDSNYIVDVFMWPNLVTLVFLCKKLSQSQFYKDLTRKTAFFEEWSWFKFSNLGLALGTNLKFYASVAKGLKTKVRKFWRIISTSVEVKWGENWLDRLNWFNISPFIYFLVNYFYCVISCLKT